MEHQRHRTSTWRKVIGHIQTNVGAGVLVTLPIGVTIFILKFLFDLLDPILRPLLQYLPGPEIPGLGIITLIGLVYLFGLVATHVVGRRLIDVGHQMIERIPVVRSIYGTTRSGVAILTGSKDHPYRGVVLVEFPRAGMKAIGLITANLGTMIGEEVVAVYIPTTPVPSSGFLVIVPVKEVIPTDMTVDDAMKIIISGGILAKEIVVPNMQEASEGSHPSVQITLEQVD